MSTIQLIQSQWEHATGYFRPALSEDMPWSLGWSLSISSKNHFNNQCPRISCHIGKSIVYDTVSNLSWSVDARTHGIVNVIDKILAEPWAPSVEVGREVPEAVVQEDCVVSWFNLLNRLLRWNDC